MVQSRSVDGFCILERSNQDEATVEVHTDGYLQPIRFTVTRENVGLEMLRATLGMLQDHPTMFYIKVAGLLHYPECWDTVTYPTLYHAVLEISTGFPCQCGDVRGGQGPTRHEMGVEP